MRTSSLLLATSLILLTACSQGTDSAVAEAAGASPGSGVAMAVNPVAHQDGKAKSGQDAAGQDKPAKGEEGPAKKDKPKKGFVPPPAKKVPGAAPNSKGQPGATPSSGAPGTRDAGRPGQPSGDQGRLGAEELKKKLIESGATDEEVQKKLAALTGGKGATPGLSTQVDPDAKLVVEFGKEKFDFGRARQGDILEHNFEMQAGGTSPLRIRQASPTCGCTVGEVSVEGEGGEMVPYQMGDPIEPGRKVSINAKLNTTSKRNRTQVRINVYHNDPVGVSMLALTADIEPFITATPPFLNFGDVKMGETRTQTIDIRTSRGEPVALKADDARPIPVPAGMEVDLVPVNPGEDGRAAHWQAKVTVGPDAKEGSMGYQLALVTDVELAEDHSKHNHAPGEHVDPPGVVAAPSYQKVAASVSARILGALSHTPQFVSMGLVRPGQVVPRVVKVISHEDDFDLSNVKAIVRGDKGGELPFAEHFSTSVKPSANANGVDVELRLNGLPENSDGSFRGELVISTGHESKPEIIVHFSGVCRAGVRTKGTAKAPK